MFGRVDDKKNKLGFNLSLVYQERIGDIIFLIGTLLAIVSTFQAEQSILAKALENRSVQDNSAYTIAVSSWLFFASSLIFWHVAVIRLTELKKTIEPNSSSTEFQGSLISTAGSVIKAIGFGLAAIGNQIKANSSGLLAD